MKHLYTPIMTLILAFSVTGCAVATAGVKKGDERSVVGSIKDVNAGRVIKARMKRALDNNLKGVDVEVAEGIVLLSGNAPTQQDKIEAGRIAWSARGIEQVGNEIQIKGKQPFIRNTKDGLLEKSVRIRMTADKYVKARNFNIETNDGIVYVLGVARTEAELKRAAEIAATTKGARQVISYARIADIPLQSQRELEEQANARLTAKRELPSVLQSAPSGPIPQAPSYQAQVPAPVTNLPPNQPIPFAAPTAPDEIDIGDRLGKEFPTDEELGAYRTGKAGEAVSIIESAPYYVDPDTGEQIPIRFDEHGNIVPLIIK